MRTKLNNFLIDDVRAFLNMIETSPEMATIPGGNFETLGDFANYWKIHLNKIEA